MLDEDKEKEKFRKIRDGTISDLYDDSVGGFISGFIEGYNKGRRKK